LPLREFFIEVVGHDTSVPPYSASKEFVIPVLIPAPGRAADRRRNMRLSVQVRVRRAA